MLHDAEGDSSQGRTADTHQPAGSLGPARSGPLFALALLRPLLGDALRDRGVQDRPRFAASASQSSRPESSRNRLFRKVIGFSWPSISDRPALAWNESP